MAKFQPQSPVTGDNITPRMRQVKDEIDRRFGPFISIGCYRPGTFGEHPLGRACDFMLSSGGVIGAEVASRNPVRMIESGPAAGAFSALGAAGAGIALASGPA